MLLWEFTFLPQKLKQKKRGTISFNLQCTQCKVALVWYPAVQMCGKGALRPVFQTPGGLEVRVPRREVWLRALRDALSDGNMDAVVLQMVVYRATSPYYWTTIGALQGRSV